MRGNSAVRYYDGAVRYYDALLLSPMKSTNSKTSELFR